MIQTFYGQIGFNTSPKVILRLKIPPSQGVSSGPNMLALHTNLGEAYELHNQSVKVFSKAYASDLQVVFATW